MQQWSEKYFKKVFFNLYLPFNIAIAAVSPIEEHGSAACFVTIQAHMYHVTTLPARSESVATLLSLWLWQHL